MPDVFDDIIDRQASPVDSARRHRHRLRFSVRNFRDRSVCREAAAARPEARGRRADESRRMANVLNTKPELLREFCGHLAKPGDETVTCTPMVGRLRYRFFETTEASLVARFN
jgi:hypothetical protein